MATNRKISRKLIENVEGLMDLITANGFTFEGINSWDSGRSVRLTLRGDVAAVVSLPDAKRSYCYAPGKVQWSASAAVKEGNREIEVGYTSDEQEIPTETFTLTFAEETRDIPYGLWANGARPWKIEPGTCEVVVACESRVAVEVWLRDRGMTLYGAKKEAA